MTTVTTPSSTSRGRVALANTSSRIGLGILGAIIAVLAWYAVALSGIVSGEGVPRPDEVVRTGWVMITEQDLIFDLRVSMTRVTIGVAVGCVAALPIGYLLAWYAPLRAMAEPLVNFFRALPPIALVPLVIVYFGIGEGARISILIYASFFAGVVVLYEGISAIDPLLIRAARVLGANRWEVFSRTVVFASIPHFFTAIRVALGVSWATVVAAELVAAQRGLGTVINDAASFYRIPDMYVGIAMIGFTALVMDLILRLAQRRLTGWQEKSR
ncbi:ABC transporter permease [Haloactinopolyspora sp.]|uniref:ABC transporter permease n=1 Tax=Haloactinopolyspora sp. TaxID=1966353 RepID=UPI00262A11DD|nr:ABC transporter permease [Haloactinopolyspora sp.]